MQICLKRKSHFNDHKEENENSSYENCPDCELIYKNKVNHSLYKKYDALLRELDIITNHFSKFKPQKKDIINEIFENLSKIEQ